MIKDVDWNLLWESFYLGPELGSATSHYKLTMLALQSLALTIVSPNNRKDLGSLQSLALTIVRLTIVKAYNR